MFEFTGESAQAFSWFFLAATGFIAVKGIRTRNPDGHADFVHLLFGCIAAVFFFLTLFKDILGVIKF